MEKGKNGQPYDLTKSNPHPKFVILEIRSKCFPKG